MTVSSEDSTCRGGVQFLHNIPISINLITAVCTCLLPLEKGVKETGLIGQPTLPYRCVPWNAHVQVHGYHRAATEQQTTSNNVALQQLLHDIDQYIFLNTHNTNYFQPYFILVYSTLSVLQRFITLPAMRTTAKLPCSVASYLCVDLS